MNRYLRKICTMFLTGTVCLSVFSGCSSSEQTPPLETSDAGESAAEDGAGEEGSTKSSSLGEFSIEDIYGETYTNEMFSEYDLTMVNIFATWCTPCINEIPDLQELYIKMKDQGVGIAGIVLDTADLEGNKDEEAVEKAKILAKELEVTYPFLIPDKALMSGRLKGIDAVPETFFVDKNGMITGESYTGSRSLKAWEEIVETELEALEGDHQ